MATLAAYAHRSALDLPEDFKDSDNEGAEFGGKSLSVYSFSNNATVNSSPLLVPSFMSGYV